MILKLSKIKGHVVFKDVHFGYLENQEVIKGFSAEIKPGQKVAIVGPTGAGKTTIVNLLMRFYEINQEA
jgi:ATP-binding cassette, subfamily B, multidrug efflux pump